MPKTTYEYGYWNGIDESWSMTGSGKFQLTVSYGGRTFEAKFKDQDKCRTDIQSRIAQAVQLGIVSEE